MTFFSIIGRAFRRIFSYMGSLTPKRTTPNSATPLLASVNTPEVSRTEIVISNLRQSSAELENQLIAAEMDILEYHASAEAHYKSGRIDLAKNALRCKLLRKGVSDRLKTALGHNDRLIRQLSRQSNSAELA